MIIPLFPGPLRWLGVAETEAAFYQQSFWLYGPAHGSTRHFSKNSEPLEHAEQLREVQLFLSFARFPWKRVSSDGPLRIIEYRDLAFADHPLGIPLSANMSETLTRLEFSVG